MSVEQGFIKTQHLAVKRIQREVKNMDTVESENRSLDCVDTVFELEGTSDVTKNRYTPFDPCPPEVPRGLWDNLLN